jgi:hypothetical protein
VSITYIDHKQSLASLLGFFSGLKAQDLPDGEAWAVEHVSLSTHNARIWMHLALSSDDGSRPVARYKLCSLSHGKASADHSDGGGSNGSRVCLWKRELQRLVDQLGISIEVHHLRRCAPATPCRRAPSRR